MQDQLDSVPEATSPASNACHAWFDAVDREVESNSVRDAEATPIENFPALRVNRFLASYRNDVEALSRMTAWVAHLGALDQAGRRHEFLNLPPAALQNLGVDSAAQALGRSQTCRDLLVSLTMGSPEKRTLLRTTARVPDNYQTWKRLVGLYAVTKVPFLDGVRRWESNALSSLQRPQTTASGSDMVRYESPAPRASAEEVRALIHAIPRDALGVPWLSETTSQLLLNTYAPRFDIETAASFDRPGRLHWASENAVTPTVDHEKPALYVRHAFTRWGRQVLIQLVYTAWFAQRPAEGPLDLLAGSLDGVTVRITLGPHGEPLMIDTMHPCGCYHMFFPTQGVTTKPAPDDAAEWAFTPKTLPAYSAQDRLVVGIASANHDVVAMQVEPRAGLPRPANVSLTLHNDATLQSLPRAVGQRQSMFGNDGVVRGTQRLERLVFWPMGIDDPGAMRQWGRHATAFVGRRHFDDAFLLDQRFELPPNDR